MRIDNSQINRLEKGKKREPNLDKRVGGNCMLSTTDIRGLYLLSRGFAEARTEVRAFSVHMIPAFATDTVYRK